MVNHSGVGGIGVYFLLQVSKSKGSDVSNIEIPSDILKKRYAQGEIDRNIRKFYNVSFSNFRKPVH